MTKLERFMNSGQVWVSYRPNNAGRVATLHYLDLQGVKSVKAPWCKRRVEKRIGNWKW